ncbi:cyclic nucleotide-binding domain-containing protein [Chelativorans sp. ZYF759]|uniref:Crp/Fnr family transcriptional regulator n=1 Tax=Chelativorans sp. ZYF759 TaxID=2692213 RepID=UPI00145F0C7E|nr:Crp/Fnr family transcriptional regulator [Chelativorans sp. ZYF759]NMG38155.1 cyclic nucleotide-binding domain-containing protein [Chelativorans sp. ZYF759]
MDTKSRSARVYPCQKCPLKDRKVFRDLTGDELNFISRFKKGELSVDKGGTVLAEGTRNPHLYTILKGWAFRYKLLTDGRRQIVNFAMPGDLVGLQGTLMGDMQHSVEALSPMLLCVFEREELLRLYEAHPALGYDVTWIAAREESILDENLLSVGRRSALERLAYLLSFIAERARDVGLFNGRPMEIPITQQHLADTLGLSLVHTNKTVRKLAQGKLLRWRDGGCEILDLERLEDLAGWSPVEFPPRPFI